MILVIGPGSRYCVALKYIRVQPHIRRTKLVASVLMSKVSSVRGEGAVRKYLPLSFPSLLFDGVSARL